MTYSIVGILASMLLVISKQDILLNHDGQTLSKTQRKLNWFFLYLCLLLAQI